MAQPSLIELTGQMLVAGFEGTALNASIHDLIGRRRVGGVILFERNFETPEQLTRLIADMQQLALSTPPHLPLFVSVDQEGGRVSRLGPPFSRFPHPCCLGKARSPALARRFGLALGKEMRAVGINMDYAPVLDVHTNPENPIIGPRALSEDPQEAARQALAFLDGFREAGVLAVGKHFPGHGDTHQDSHLTLPVVEKTAAELEAVELVPFARAIEHGLEILMTAHVIYKAWDPARPATFSSAIIQDILKDRLGFEGVVISDDLEMKAVEDHLPLDEYPKLGIEAGIDLFLICHSQEKIGRLQDRMIEEAGSGRIPSNRVETSARKVMALKKKLPPVSEGLTDLNALAQQHHELIQEMQSHL